MNSVTASAPCRADLAGGTLDLWPLGLLVERAVTVNAALSLRTGCSIEAGGETWVFHARDGREELELARLPERADRAVPPAFRLAASVASWFDLPASRIETWSQAARGSGLGGSSSLIVSLIAAARALRGEDWRSKEADSIRLARDLEARILGLPAGSQDHVAAWHGGLSLIEYGPGGWTRSRPPGFEEAASELGEALVVADSGVAHHSGLNNWQVYKAFLEGEAGVRAAMEGVASAAVEMADVLASGAQGAELLGGVGAALSREWQARRQLSSAVTCPEVDALVAAATEAGGSAKVCGAGGGGCIVALPGSPESRGELVAALRRAGGHVLLAGLDTQGVQVRQP